MSRYARAGTHLRTHARIRENALQDTTRYGKARMSEEEGESPKGRVGTHMHPHICTRTFIHTHTHTHTRTRVHTHTHVHINTCTRTCTHTHKYAHARTHEQMHTRVQTLYVHHCTATTSSSCTPCMVGVQLCGYRTSSYTTRMISVQLSQRAMSSPSSSSSCRVYI